MSKFEFAKSTYSSGDRECIEVATNIPTTIAIRDSKDPGGPILRFTPDAWTAFQASLVDGAFEFAKSSYSSPSGECVEVATNMPATVAIRDSKDPDGPILCFTPDAWAAFRAAVVEGQLNP